MARAFQIQSKTTGILLVVNAILLGAIMLVAFNDPFSDDVPADLNVEEYGLQTELARLADPDHTTANGSNAAAQAVETGHPCIIALERSARLSVNMYGSSSLVAPKCTVHSHSKSPFGVNLENVDRLNVAAVYSGGSAGRAYDSLGLQMIVDSSETFDPFAGVETPQGDQCDHRDLILKTGSHLLQPGVYCGGIVSLTSKEITLAPGVYIIKNGPLAIGGKATFSGNGVSLIFDGPNAVFSFGVATKLALTAPLTGPLAGIIFFENPNSPKNREFVVRSHDAGLLEGAIYLPRGKFVVDSYGQVGHSAKWSAIVANQIEIINGASLHINSDHAGSDVPRPTYLSDHRDLTLASAD
ncbi:MAG: hypothetical protein ABJH63_13775 [Rhizobiaceae bacterium]